VNNEKYLNYYIETMTNTLSECVVKIVSLQANAKVTDDVISEKEKTIEDLNKQLLEKAEAFQKKDKELKDLNVQKNEEITGLRKQIEDKNFGYNDSIEKLKIEFEQKNVIEVKNLKGQIDSLRAENGRLSNEVNNLVKIAAEYDSMKNQVSHMDTFRSELLKARKETEDVRAEMGKTISELNVKISSYEKPVVINTGTKAQKVTEETNKDSGSF